MKKRILAVLIVMAICLSALPITKLEADDVSGLTPDEETSQTDGTVIEVEEDSPVVSNDSSQEYQEKSQLESSEEDGQIFADEEPFIEDIGNVNEEAESDSGKSGTADQEEIVGEVELIEIIVFETAEEETEKQGTEKEETEENSGTESHTATFQANRVSPEDETDGTLPEDMVIYAVYLYETEIDENSVEVPYPDYSEEVTFDDVVIRVEEGAEYLLMPELSDDDDRQAVDLLARGEQTDDDGNVSYIYYQLAGWVSDEGTDTLYGTRTAVEMGKEDTIWIAQWEEYTPTLLEDAPEASMMQSWAREGVSGETECYGVEITQGINNEDFSWDEDNASNAMVLTGEEDVLTYRMTIKLGSELAGVLENSEITEPDFIEFQFVVRLDENVTAGQELLFVSSFLEPTGEVLNLEGNPVSNMELSYENGVWTLTLQADTEDLGSEFIIPVRWKEGKYSADALQEEISLVLPAVTINDGTDDAVSFTGEVTGSISLDEGEITDEEIMTAYIADSQDLNTDDEKELDVTDTLDGVATLAVSLQTLSLDGNTVWAQSDGKNYVTGISLSEEVDGQAYAEEGIFAEGSGNAEEKSLDDSADDSEELETADQEEPVDETNPGETAPDETENEAAAAEEEFAENVSVAEPFETQTEDATEITTDEPGKSSLDELSEDNETEEDSEVGSHTVTFRINQAGEESAAEAALPDDMVIYAVYRYEAGAGESIVEVPYPDYREEVSFDDVVINVDEGAEYLLMPELFDEDGRQAVDLLARGEQTDDEGNIEYIYYQLTGWILDGEIDALYETGTSVKMGEEDTIWIAQWEEYTLTGIEVVVEASAMQSWVREASGETESYGVEILQGLNNEELSWDEDSAMYALMLTEDEDVLTYRMTIKLSSVLAGVVENTETTESGAVEFQFVVHLDENVTAGQELMFVSSFLEPTGEVLDLEGNLISDMELSYEDGVWILQTDTEDLGSEFIIPVRSKDGKYSANVLQEDISLILPNVTINEGTEEAVSFTGEVTGRITLSEAEMENPDIVTAYIAAIQNLYKDSSEKSDVTDTLNCIITLQASVQDISLDGNTVWAQLGEGIPATGGPGTRAWAVAGGLMVIAAGLLYFCARRRRLAVL